MNKYSNNYFYFFGNINREFKIEEIVQHFHLFNYLTYNESKISRVELNFQSDIFNIQMLIHKGFRFKF